MQKTMIWVALLWLALGRLAAQSSPLDSIQAPYQNLSTTNIPSGILWDRAYYLPGIHPDKDQYDGQANSAIGSKRLFDEFVNLANMAAYHDSIAIPPDSFYARRNTAIEEAY